MQATIKIQSKGKSTLHTCYLNGEVIGTRTSKTRVYPYAVLVMKDVEQDKNSLSEKIKFHSKNIVRYTRLSQATTVEELMQLEPPRNQAYAWDVECLKKNLEEKAYAKYLSWDVDALEKAKKELAKLEAGDLGPEYAVVGVYSWHTALHLVPTVVPGMKVVGLAKMEEVHYESATN